MLFSTPFFVFCFLPALLAISFVVPARRLVLLLASCIFYGWSEPVFILVVLASAIFDWLIGFQIVKQSPKSRLWVALGVAGNLGLLVYAKYTIFAITNVNSLLSSLGLNSLTIPQIALPLGVSFIVFEKITYLVDLGRHSAPPAKSLLDYLNYIFLFPKLLAGPIVKYHDIAEQLSRPKFTFENLQSGLLLFLVGLGKKVLIADILAPVADKVFALPADALNPTTAWLGLACFSLQIFYDFSGYSDMAIGLAGIFGFRLKENFRDPYLATSFTDFWRRWHISLSSWIKEYLYIPLGGSRVSKARSYANLCICFLISGLWHGASWNFVVWGSLHGVALAADRAFWLQISERLPRWFNISLTLLLVALTWVFFRCETFSKALIMLASLGGAAGPNGNDVFLTREVLFVLLAGAFLVFKPLLPLPNFQMKGKSWRIATLAGGLVILIVCAGQMVVSSFHPFLYFRF
jgi:alginate O-acetyltransferase complex protein AlgI